MDDHKVIVCKLSEYISEVWEENATLTDYYETTKGDYVLKYINQQDQIEIVTITRATYNAIINR